MFGIDFPELVVIAVVALIVIGPEHLPKVARTVGHLWGRAQRYVSSVKADMSRDMALDELRKLQQTAQQEVSNIKLAMSEASQEVAQQLSDIESDVTASKYDLGQSIPPNEVSTKVLDKNELLKSEMPRGNAAESSMSAGNMPQSNIPKHEIIEEHHAVLPISAEHKKTTSS